MSLLKIPSFLQVQVLLTVFILNTCTTVVYVIFSKNSSQSVSCETWCKGKDFYFYLPNFFEVFFRFIFFRKFFRNDFRTFAWIFQPHPSVYLFPDPLTPLSSCHHRISLDCGYKSTAVKHIFQIFSQLFYNYFLLSLIVNDLQMHFSPLFYFPLPFLFLLSKFSIFNLHSQFSKSRRVFIISRRLSSKRRRLFSVSIRSFDIEHPRFVLDHFGYLFTNSTI